MKFEWELIDDYSKQGEISRGEQTHRVKVIGGWIVKSYAYAAGRDMDSDIRLSETMVFVPDPDHEWVIDE